MQDKLDNIELRSEEVQEILTKVPHWMIRYGNTLFLIIILALLVFSWLIKYPDVVTAQATLTTVIPPQKEYAKVTGKLDQILVEDSVQVVKDQVLAVIENSANYKDVSILKTIMDTIEVEKRRFEFPVNQIPYLFLGEIESNYALFENNYLNYTLNKQLKPNSGKLRNNEITLQELRNRITNLKSQQKLNASELNFQKKNLERNKILYDKGVISLKEYEATQLDYLKEKRNYKNISSSIFQLKEAISNARQQSRETNINMQMDEALLYKKAVQSFQQLKSSIKEWELKYILKSNINGTVSFMNFWSPNQTVKQGDWIFSIIPPSNLYIANLRIPVQNSGKVRNGQKVNIRLHNYPYEEFGTLKGKVNSISSVPNNENSYMVEVLLPNELITSYKKNIDFQPDLKGTAEIITQDLRLIERFFYQFKKLIDRG